VHIYNFQSFQDANVSKQLQKSMNNVIKKSFFIVLHEKSHKSSFDDVHIHFFQVHELLSVRTVHTAIIHF